jgi:hypothetical protein
MTMRKNARTKKSNIVSQRLTKARKPRRWLKHMPKTATKHYRWYAGRFEVYYMHNGASYRPIQSTTYLNATN